MMPNFTTVLRIFSKFCLCPNSHIHHHDRVWSKHVKLNGVRLLVMVFGKWSVAVVISWCDVVHSWQNLFDGYFEVIKSSGYTFLVISHNKFMLFILFYHLWNETAKFHHQRKHYIEFDDGNFLMKLIRLLNLLMMIMARYVY
jgi:hypothetical protein